MAKRKSKSLFGKYGKFILVLVAVVTLCMAFLPAVKSTNGDNTYTGFDVMFGKSLGSVNIFVANGESSITFSILAVLGFMLPLVGSIISALLIKDKGIAGLITCACFIASAVLLFLIPSITSVSTTASTIITSGTTTTSTFKELGYELGIGSIIGASVSIVGALGSLYSVIK